MTKLSLVFLTLILLCIVSSTSQSKLKSSPRKSAVVTFQGNDLSLTGSHEGAGYLKLNGEVKKFHWGAQTRFYNFRSGRAWDDGAEWRVIYSPSSERQLYDFELWSATFTGRVLR